MTLTKIMKLADEYAEACVSENNENFGNSEPRETTRRKLSLAIHETLIEEGINAHQSAMGEAR